MKISLTEIPLNIVDDDANNSDVEYSISTNSGSIDHRHINGKNKKTKR